MADFKPSLPYNVAAYLLIPKSQKIKGVLTKVYPKPTEGELFYCSFKTFGGTETNKDGVISVVDTANIETWYRPDIKSDCRICLAQEPTKLYEILGTPENINMRNQHLKFKVQAISGGA